MAGGWAVAGVAEGGDVVFVAGELAVVDVGLLAEGGVGGE